MVINNNVKLLDIDDPGWLEFVHASSDANIFHSPAWSEVLAETYHLKSQVIAVQDQGRNITAALPYLEKRKLLGGREWLSLPFSDHCEILAKDESALDELVKIIQQRIGILGLKEIEVRSGLPTSSWHQISDKYILHKLQLEEDPKNLWKRLHSMHRRNIRHAQKKSLRVQRGSTLKDMKAFYQIHLETRNRKGVPIQPWAFFKNLSKFVIEKDLGFILLVYEEEDCVAGSVFLNWGRTLTYKYGASLMRAQTSRANNLMMWFAIEWGCRHGYEILDLGRTELANKGLRSYKSRYGAEEYPLVYTTSSPKSSNSVSEKMLDFATPVLQRLPKWFTRLSGELIYRLFV